VSPAVLPEIGIGTDQPSHQLSRKKNPGSPTSSACPTKPMSDVEKNEICLFFIRRHCSFKGSIVVGRTDLLHLQCSNLSYVSLFVYECLVRSFTEKCARVHWHLPYRWQVLEKDGKTWKDLPSMEDIEKAYCDPACDTSCMDQPSARLGLLRYLTFQR